MLRRATVLAAVIVMLGASSGMAWEGSDVELALFHIDTADHVGLDVATKVNDSILFTSEEFAVPANAIAMIVRMVETTQDTLLDDDSLLFDVQTRLDHDYDSAWFRVGGSTLIDDDGTMNTVGATCRVTVDSDSIMSFGDMGRVRLWVVAEEATIRAADVSGIMQFNAVYWALVRFKLR